MIYITYLTSSVIKPLTLAMMGNDKRHMVYKANEIYLLFQSTNNTMKIKHKVNYISNTLTKQYLNLYAAKDIHLCSAYIR